MSPAGDVHVVGFRLHFADGSREARAEASERAPTILIGPRADRCNGLYAHDPPRGAAELFAELGEAQAEATRATDDRDRAARALQKSYDVALELASRLAADADQQDLELSKQGRARLREELGRARATAREVGRRIGCVPPER